MSAAADNLDLDALKAALEDGKITEKEREELITRGVPDLLIEALEDGVLDETEMQALGKLGFPKPLLEALRDGHLTDAEVRELKAKMAGNMKAWREQQLKSLFEILHK